MQDDYTDITVILDRSGSMDRIAADMCGGFNRMIADQRAAPGKCLVSLRQFNTRPQVIYEGRDVKDVPPLTLRPSGGTALYDALAYAIEGTGFRLDRTPEAERPSKVLFIVITDGEENSSVEYVGPAGAARIKAMIERQTQVYKWQFVYLGADASAFKHATDLGMMGVQYSASPAGAQAMNSVVSNAVLRYRGGAAGQSISITSNIGEVVPPPPGDPGKPDPQ